LEYTATLPNQAIQIDKMEKYWFKTFFTYIHKGKFCSEHSASRQYTWIQMEIDWFRIPPLRNFCEYRS